MVDNSTRPIIIKRKKVVAGGGHHGGAWKVAYADFVTAMMASFMLMWLLEPPPLNWSVPIVRKTENRRWELRDRSLKRLLLS